MIVVALVEVAVCVALVWVLVALATQLWERVKR